MWMAAISGSVKCKVENSNQEMAVARHHRGRGANCCHGPFGIDRLRWPDRPCCRCTRGGLGLKLADAL